MATDMQAQQDWEFLGGRPIDDKEASLIAARVIPPTSQQLQALLAIQPDALQRVLDLMRRRFDDGIVAETYTRLMANLDIYLGSEPSYMLAWLAQVQSDPEEMRKRLEALNLYAAPEVVAFCRTVIGSYGPEIEKALARSGEFPNNWNMISREVFIDKLTSAYFIRLTIEKFTGEKVTLEGNPDSILALATAITMTARLVGSRDGFTEERIESYLEEADLLGALLRPTTKKKRHTLAEKNGSALN